MKRLALVLIITLMASGLAFGESAGEIIDASGVKGGVLSVTDKADGKVLSEFELDSAPVFDGMIAADKKLFISMVDGSVICLEGK